MFDSITFDTTENKALYGGILGGAGVTVIMVVYLGIRYCRLRRKHRLLRRQFDEKTRAQAPILCLNVEREVKRDPELPPVYNQSVSLEEHQQRL
jgi:hypothetical protein